MFPEWNDVWVERGERRGKIHDPQTVVDRGTWQGLNTPCLVFASSFIWLSAALSAEQTSSPWQISLTPNKAAYLVREPVLLTVEWKNVSGKQQLLMLTRPKVWMVGRKRQEERRRFLLFQTWDELEAGIGRPKVMLPPGACKKLSFWIALGSSDGSYDWDFLFPSPGEWTMSLPNAPEAKAEFRVTRPVSKEDRRAVMLFSRPTAEFFLGNPPAKKAIDNSKTICDEYPRSRYAPYAAISLAKHFLKRPGGSRADLGRYKSYLDLIIEKHPGSHLREEAFYLLIRGYVFQKGGKREAAKIAERLAKEHPKSPYVAKIPRQFRIRPGKLPAEPRPVVPKKSGIGRFSATGLERIPEGPRRVFQAYWKALAAERFDEAQGFLSGDFLGNFGDRDQMLKAWRKGSQHSNIVSFVFDLEGFKEQDSLALAPTRAGGTEKLWKGRIVVIVGSATSRKVNIWSGHESASRFGPVTIAMRESDGEWKLIAQRVESRNRKAGALASELFWQLQGSLKSVKLWDGEKDVVLSDELESRLAKDAVKTELSWKSRGMTMTGEGRDTPLIRGEVTTDITWRDGKRKTVSHLVTLTLELVGDRLRLSGIETQRSGSE